MATVTATPPVPVVRLVERLRHYLYRIQARLAPPPVAMLDLIVAGWVSQAIEAAAELGVADALVSGPLRPDELARKVGADPDAFDRLLRTLISRGMFRRHRNSASASTRSGTPCVATQQCPWPGRRCSTDRPSTESTGACWRSRSERESPAFLRCAGWGCSTSCARTPFGQTVRRSDDQRSELAQGSIVAAYDFGAHDHDRCRQRPRPTVVGDTAGHPERSQVLYDLPEIASGADPLLRKLDVAEPVCVEAGSFFDGVPGGGDAYVLKDVVHDWPDDDAVAILRDVRSAGDASAVVVLVGAVIPDHDRDFIGNGLTSRCSWASMAATPTAEYGHCSSVPGLEMTRVIPARSPSAWSRRRLGNDSGCQPRSIAAAW